MESRPAPVHMNANRPYIRCKYLYSAALLAVLVITSVCLLLINRSIIGGNAYVGIRNCSDAIEQIALINSGLFQITNEIHQLANDTDKGAGSIKALSGEVDNRFIELSLLLKSHDRREIVIKTDTIWQEYRKTLHEEVLPAAAKGNILKVTYLLTGIQAQRIHSINRAFNGLSQHLRQDVALYENNVTSSSRLTAAVIAMAVSITMGLSAVFYLVLRTRYIKPLHDCTEFALKLSKGKSGEDVVTASADRTCGLAQALNMIAANMRNSVSDASCGPESQPGAQNRPTDCRPDMNAPSPHEHALHRLASTSFNLLTSSETLSYDASKLSSYASDRAVSTMQVAAGIDELALNSDRVSDMANDMGVFVTELHRSLQEMNSGIINLQDSICSANRYINRDETGINYRADLQSTGFSTLESSFNLPDNRDDMDSHMHRQHDGIREIMAKAVELADMTAHSSSSSSHYLEQLSTTTEHLSDLLMYMRSSAHRYSSYAAVTADSSLSALDMSKQIKASCTSLNRSCLDMSAAVSSITSMSDLKQSSNDGTVRCNPHNDCQTGQSVDDICT